MRITERTPVNKTRTRVQIDDDLTLVLSNRDLLQFHLTEGTEISEETWQELMEKQYKDALYKCGSLLKDRDYSRSALCRKLLQSGFPEETVQRAVLAMEEAHYVDDRRYARQYLETHAGTRSRLRLRMDLISRGISGELLDEVFSSWEEENEEQVMEEEIRQIRELMRKKHFDPDEADWQNTQKMMAFLARKGYSQDVIRAALDS